MATIHDGTAFGLCRFCMEAARFCAALELSPLSGLFTLPPSNAATGPLLALLAALFWGGGDFAGGMGAKASGGSSQGALRMIVAAHMLSLLVLASILGVQGHIVLHGAAVAWGLGSGVVAGLSLAAFYVALARGEMGASAAVSGLLAAAIPAGVGMLLEGRPTTLRLIGFLVAAVAIWMVAAPAPQKEAIAQPKQPTGVLALALGGGIGFGLYFTALKFANGLGVLEPLALARVGSIVTSLVLLGGIWLQQRGHRHRRSSAQNAVQPPWLPQTGWWGALGVAVLDSGGNLLYIAATRAGRLDVAAVLAALYPASTILLAAAVLKEKPDRRQLLGMAVAVAAVIMVTV